MNTAGWIKVLEGRQRNTSAVAIRITRSVIDDRLFRDMHEIGVRPPRPEAIKMMSMWGFIEIRRLPPCPVENHFLVFYAHNYM